MFIEHKSSGIRNKYDKLIWDLGIRIDVSRFSSCQMRPLLTSDDLKWENSPKMHVDQIKSLPNLKVRVEKDVATILAENGERLEDIGGIIWSHWHFVSHTICFKSRC